MRVVYRLAEDSRGFASSGLSDRVASGEIPLHTSRGVITKLYMGSMNDWPEFTMRSDSGEESSWSRYGNSRGDGRHYEPGRRIEVDYVLQSDGSNALDPRAEYKTVVEVRIEVPPETIRQRIVRHRATGQW
jgi:hypothetical protein